jgi:hypothetical protein
MTPITELHLRKRLTVKKVVGKRKPTWWERICIFFDKVRVKNNKSPMIDLNTYEEVENDDDFVKYGKPYLDTCNDVTGNVQTGSGETLKDL